MSLHYDVEKDHLYQKGFKVGFKIGFEQGYREGMTLGILSLKNENHSIEEIAELLDLTQDEIIELLKNSTQKKG
jgi:flagellar biosynthesis/type III secretory pathway protein FliH